MIKFKPDICSGCRICMLTCSSEKYGVYNPYKSKIQITSYDDDSKFKATVCIQCGKCYKVCPVNAIEKKGKNYILHEDMCIRCGNCKDVCPFDAIIVYGDEEIFMKCDTCGACVRNCPQKALEIKGGE